MLLVWEPHSENYCSGLEEQAQFCGWRREAREGDPAGLTVLRTLSCFCVLRLRSPQPIPNPQDPSHLSCWSPGLTSDLSPFSPVPLLPGAAPRALLVCGPDGPAPASIRGQQWRLPLLRREQWLRLGGVPQGHWQEPGAVILGHLLSP